MTDPLRIAAVGEVLWDVFPDGPRFGGAPANFACHTAALGARSSIVSCVGQDALGRRGRLVRRTASVPSPQLWFVWPLAATDLSGRARAELLSEFLNVRARPSFYSHKDIATVKCGVDFERNWGLLWCRLDLNDARRVDEVAPRWLADVRRTCRGNRPAWAWWLKQRFALKRALRRAEGTLSTYETSDRDPDKIQPVEIRSHNRWIS